MNFSIETNRRSATFKVLAVGVLILVLLIPISMVKGVVFDRMHYANEVVADIRGSWGDQQIVAGPLFRVPFRALATNSRGETYAVDKFAYLVAEKLIGSAKTAVEERQRGIHEVLVYKSEIETIASFDFGALEALDIDPEALEWSRAELVVGLTDRAAVSATPSVTINGKETSFASTTQQVNGLPPVLSAPLGRHFKPDVDAKTLDVTIRLSLNGTEALQFLPLAERSEYRVTSDWPSPSFSGRRLPSERNVTDSGFDAVWTSTGIARILPSVWINGDASPNMFDDGGFGVRFMTPVGLYQLMDRALKYAILFIGLTFITYFLMETVASIRLHPLQYLLVGLANSLFYLLLLSLAEHVGFGLAYVASSAASATLIIGYSSTVLGARARTVVMAVVISGLYGFLYLTLMAESFALLAGSIGLWGILGTTMYLTRNVDWFTTVERNNPA